jgi:plastocyanin
MLRTTKAGLVAMAFIMAALSGASAQETALRLTIKNNRFEPAELRAPAGKPIRLLIQNLDRTPEEFESKTLRVEKIIAAQSEATVQIRALQPGRYRFYGEFHEATAQGALVVE